MKLPLLIPLTLALMSFEAFGLFSSSSAVSYSSNPMAAICNGIFEDTIQKSDLVNCDGLKIIDSKTHEELSNEVTSYEVIIIRKSGGASIEQNYGSSFCNVVKEYIKQLQSVDRIIFRKIGATGECDQMLRMNAIPLIIK